MLTRARSQPTDIGLRCRCWIGKRPIKHRRLRKALPALEPPHSAPSAHGGLPTCDRFKRFSAPRGAANVVRSLPLLFGG